MSSPTYNRLNWIYARGLIQNRITWTFYFIVNRAPVNLAESFEDYIPIHKFFDQSKLFIADWRHRALLHHTLGVSLCEQMFGDFYTRPSDGQKISTRLIAEQHVLEDLGALPDLAWYIPEMRIRRWMNGMTPEQRRRTQKLVLEDNQKKLERDYQLYLSENAQI